MNKPFPCILLLITVLILVSIVGCGGFGDTTITDVPAGAETVNENDAMLESALKDFYTHQNEKGLTIVEDVLKNSPDNTMALALQAAFKMRQDEGEAGFADANHAIEIDPKVAFAYVVRSWYYDLYESDSAAAEAESERALTLDPELAFAYGDRGGAKLSQGDFQGALKDYEHAIELEPDYMMAYANIGFINIELDNLDLAVKALDRAIEINSNIDYLYAARGDAYLYAGDNDSAKVDYTNAIELGSEDAHVYASRAWIN